MPPLRGSFYFFNRLSAKETLFSQSDRRLSGERISKVSAARLSAHHKNRQEIRKSHRKPKPSAFFLQRHQER
jgi:hypothetical protein